MPHKPTDNSTSFTHEYKDMSSVQFAAAKEALTKLHPSKDSLKILDVGCGDGKVTSKLVNLFPHAKITGIDVSHELISLAIKEYANDQLTFLQQDVREITDISYFDIIFSFFCLHLIPISELESTILKLFKALKPSGQLFVAIPMRDSTLTKIRKHVIKQFREELADYRLPTHYDEKNYFLLFRKMSKLHGFTILEESCAEYDPNLSIQEFKSFFSAISRERRILKNNKTKIAFVEKIADKMPRKENSSIDYKFSYIVLHLKRFK